MAISVPNAELKASEEYRTLREGLLSTVQYESSFRDSLCNLVEKSYSKSQNADNVEAVLWKLWQSVTSLAVESTSDSERQRLVDLILELQKRPDLEESGKVCKVWDAVVWRDLPVLGAQMREAWNETADDSSPKESQIQWLNLNAFTATLVASAHAKSDQPDLSIFGLWTIRTALEESTDKPDGVSLVAAKLWFKHASSAVHDFSEKSKVFDGKVAKPGFSYSKESWRGFSPERWDVWQQRLGELGTAD
ncbi:hypothetical protein B0A48_05164 [Cryoendolithus antarcticus]|uniref:Uncharacterized protein n=1 Tax=Cryoendolithus antarcticus TaxID=1507870 RepID=A0A1V8TES2_9PEZI|nr:hypothetical protein B0A48_05164 [Cryoendolithus antarcticus]